MQMITYFLIKGGSIGCFRMAARYAPIALNEINTALSEGDVEAPGHPVGCAAMLAQRMGSSDMHTAMAAGFAGGIGLSGGACGALGAAIWLLGIEDGVEKVEFESPKALAAVDRFMKCTDYEFECSEIVGRKFESVSDHAEFLSDGGCSHILKVLAAE
jgi:hypothetical protein